MPMRVLLQVLAMEHFNLELFDRPPYSPDPAPSDYHQFIYLKNWFISHRLKKEELTEDVRTWLGSQAADFFDAGLQKLIPRYKCLNSGGGCIDKQL
jgi:hypothetical protein